MICIVSVLFQYLSYWERLPCNIAWLLLGEIVHLSPLSVSSSDPLRFWELGEMSLNRFK